jgi:hypothetical protein
MSVGSAEGGAVETAAPGLDDERPVPKEVLTALNGLFAAHEVRVLGVVGILTGYAQVPEQAFQGQFSIPSTNWKQVCNTALSKLTVTLAYEFAPVPR